tara:strand:- start:97 stop:507 length:411 start_codon:yes stop_codon:yes gene_type:complete
MSKNTHLEGMEATKYDDLEGGYGYGATEASDELYYKGLMQGNDNKVYEEDNVIHKGFIRKVYGILSFQLLITFATAAFMSLNDDARQFVVSNMTCFYLGLGMSIVMLIALLCYKDRHPHNMILLTIWTFVEGEFVK